MELSLIFDIACVLIFVASFIFMSGKGLLKCSFKLVSIIVSFVLVVALTDTCMSFMENTRIGSFIDQTVYNAVIPDKEYNEKTETVESTDEDKNTIALPNFIGNAVNEAKEGVLAPKISEIVKRLFAGIFIFVLSRLFLTLLFLFVECIFKLPGLKTVNRLLGGVIGIISGLIIIYVICGLMSLSVENAARIREIMDKTYIVKYFYDYNILMELFLLI